LFKEFGILRESGKSVKGNFISAEFKECCIACNVEHGLLVEPGSVMLL
jgi:hypothetical protein